MKYFRRLLDDQGARDLRVAYAFECSKLPENNDEVDENLEEVADDKGITDNEVDVGAVDTVDNSGIVNESNNESVCPHCSTDAKYLIAHLKKSSMCRKLYARSLNLLESATIQQIKTRKKNNDRLHYPSRQQEVRANELLLKSGKFVLYILPKPINLYV